MKVFILALAVILLAGFQPLLAIKKQAPKHPMHRHHSRHHRPMHKRTYYSGHDDNVRFKKGDAGRPSPYNGDNVPENDGVKKNEERNKNYQTGQPLPPNNGNNGK